MNQLVDMHCHVLPGIDDGSRNMEQSLNMVKIASEQGIGTMILTPHFHPAKGSHDIEKWKETLRALDKNVKNIGIEMKFYLGAELFFTHDASSYIESGKVISMADSDYMLVEFRPETEFSYIRSAIYDIQSVGKIPIIAHIERYDCLLGNMDRIEEISDQGALIQVNASSITGNMGFSVKQYLKKLLKKEMIDFVGTDAHTDVHRAPFMEACFKYVRKKCGEEYALRIMRDNALKIVANQEI